MPNSIERLETLELGNNDLEGSLPDLGSISALTALAIRDNRIIGIIPEGILGLNLTAFIAQNNMMTVSEKSNLLASRLRFCPYLVTCVDN